MPGKAQSLQKFHGKSTKNHCVVSVVGSPVDLGTFLQALGALLLSPCRSSAIFPILLLLLYPGLSQKFYITPLLCGALHHISA